MQIVPPQILKSHNLARLLMDIGDHTRAEDFLRRALQTRERMFGANHPDTLLSMNNLASFLCRNCNYDGAEPLFRRAFTSLLSVSRSMGRPHPNLDGVIENYAELLRAMGFSREKIIAKLNELGHEFGFRLLV